MPNTARKGQVIEVKTLISHDMENGQRKDANGNTVPRKIINKFVVRFNGKEIVSADWHPAVSANPYQAFYVKATQSGTFEFDWIDDDGSVYKSQQQITVT
jgi:sulfur-oxidizing protein SoxZ